LPQPQKKFEKPFTFWKSLAENAVTPPKWASGVGLTKKLRKHYFLKEIRTVRRLVVLSDQKFLFYAVKCILFYPDNNLLSTLAYYGIRDIRILDISVWNMILNNNKKNFKNDIKRVTFKHFVQYVLLISTQNVGVMSLVPLVL
jgi:hypothetical protein